MKLSSGHTDRLRKAKNYKEAVAIAKELDIDIDDRFVAEANEYFTNLKNRPLSDNELDCVSGGVINWGDGKGDGSAHTAADVICAFKIGDEVETNQWFGTQRGIITKIKITCVKGTLYYPEYYVETFKSYYSRWYTGGKLSY